MFALGGHASPDALGWAVVAVGSLAAGGSAAAVRFGPRLWVRALLWVACGAAAVSAFGLLMDAVALLVGQPVDSWVSAANHVLAACGALLLAATAGSHRRASGGTVVGPDTGHRGVDVGAPASSSAPRTVQLAAVAGTVAFLPYTVMKLIWAFGGTFAGLSGEETRAIAERNGASGVWLTLESWGLDATALLAGLGVFLLWGLVRPWGQVFPRWTPFLRGRRVPRWLVLTPALLGASTLAPYGVLGIGYLCLVSTGAVTMGRGDFPSAADALTVAWIGLFAFAVYGLALAATRSYWLRTRAGHRVRPAAADE